MIRVLLVIFSLSAVAQAQVPGQDDGFIVTFKPGTAHSQRAAAVQRAGGELRFSYSVVDSVAIRGANPDVLAALRNDPSVVGIVSDFETHAIQGSDGAAPNGKPSGGGGSTQVIPAGVSRVGVPTASSNGEGIGVAILDTGIDLAHTDLSISPTRFSAFGGSCQDDNGHGTHVAGTVAALDNGKDVLGVAPKATLYCVKVLNAQGAGSDSDLIAGLDFVFANAAIVQPPIRVVNISFGRTGTVDDNPNLRAAVKRLYDASITVVVAAGDNPDKEVKDWIPAAYPEVLAVASTTAKDGTNSCRQIKVVIKANTASSFTSDGAYLALVSSVGLQGVTISAPGEDQEDIAKGCYTSSVGILSTKLGGGTTRMSGTSMAAPHVAGIAARLVQKGIGTPESIRSALRSNPLLGVAPYDAPTGSYSFDGEREGIAKAP